MTALNWAAFAVALISIITGFVGSIRWLVKHYLNELKPNGGNSLSDRILKLEARVETIISLLER